MELKEILATYPEVMAFEHKYKDKIIDFIILLYRKDSPLILTYPELSQRKSVAALECNLDPQSDYMQSVFLLKEEPVLAIINCFLQRVQSSYTFERMISDMEIFSEFQRAMRSPVPSFDVDPDKQLKAIEIKGKLSAQSKLLEENIKAAWQELYGNDEDLRDVSIKKVRTTVESMANKK